MTPASFRVEEGGRGRLVLVLAGVVIERINQLEDALREYRRASELDPPNRQLAGKVIDWSAPAACPT